MCLLSGGTTLHIFGRTVERLEAVICENVGFLRSDTNRFAWFVGCGSLSVRDVCFSLSRVGALAWVAVGFAQGFNPECLPAALACGCPADGGFRLAFRAVVTHLAVDAAHCFAGEFERIACGSRGVKTLAFSPSVFPLAVPCAFPLRLSAGFAQYLTRVAFWLILPVVICLSQRLSHACLSSHPCTVKPRMAH